MFLSKHSNGIYYLWFNDGEGKRQKVSTRCRLKTDAYRFVQVFKHDEYLRRKQVKHKLLSDVIRDYLNVVETNLVKGTVKNYRAALKNLLTFTGDIPLVSFTPYHFDAFKSERLKSIKPVSLNIELRALRTFFNTAVRWRMFERTPFEVKLMKIPETQPTFLTKEEFQRLLSIIEEEWFKYVIIFAVCTGLRRAELINLRWNSVDLQRKIIRIECSQTFHTKSGKSRVVPLSETAYYLLKRKQFQDSSEYVFALNGKKIHDGWISHLFKRYVRAANLADQKLHFHSLRHTFASWLAQDGTSIYVIKDFLGHSDLKMTAVYSHLQPTQLHSEVNKISISLN
jgi:integrase